MVNEAFFRSKKKRIKIIDYFMIFLEIRLERLLLQYKKLKSGFIDSRNVDVMFLKKKRSNPSLRMSHTVVWDVAISSVFIFYC